MTTFILHMLMILMFCMGAIKLEAEAGLLAQDEVDALLEIATQVGKKDWNNKVDPCSNETSWVTPPSSQRPMFDNKVVCNCSFGGVCHIVSIFLKGQDLAGSLPKSIVKLPYLTNLDLWANYLSGNIPPEWANTKLEILSIAVNRLTGPIPSYLGKIITLRDLNIQNNMFSGIVPPELGNLVNLENINLCANNFTGELPLALSNLTKLKELRLSSNNFIGRIPDFIQSWKQLDILEIQAGGFSGPIPLNISLLNSLTKLRISDLLGDGSEFPNLEFMQNMTYLMLSSCNLSGPFPGYLTEMKQLKVLDLSFNRLKGDLPADYNDLKSLEIIYVTGNMLSGPIPPWIQIQNTRYEFDLSYNNFTEIPTPTNCKETLNFFKSSWGGNYSKPVECLSDYCSKDQYSVHINCGGSETTVGNTIYEADDEPGGATKYVPKREVWQISTTGHVWDVKPSEDDYIAQNMSILRMNNSELYTKARLTPLSLTYHVRCLVNGNYNVKLHFAEIVMRDNRSFYSLGRRIFDVYIQDRIVLKDFDIEKAAQGVDKVYIHNSTAKVTDTALEIRLHWAGKGTTTSPKIGIYGPLISAIDIESGKKEGQLNLDWPTRQRICVDIAKGLAFLHEESTLKIVHRDIKTTNVLLDGNMNAKISDFGMAKLDEEDNTHISTRVAGTMGYMAPEYALYGRLTYKADVYSFGIVALEIVAGMSIMSFQHNESFVSVPDWARSLQQNGDIMELVDPRLGSAFKKKEAARMIKVALLCTIQSPVLRPTMSAVVRMLEGKGDVQELVVDPSTFGDSLRFKSFRGNSDQSSVLSIDETRSLVHSSDRTWDGPSSSSAQDMYPDH